MAELSVLLAQQNAQPGLMCFALLLGIGIAACVGAVILRAAAHWVAKVDLAPGRAMVIVLVNGVVGFVLNYVGGRVTGGINAKADLMHNLPAIGGVLASTVLAFLVQSVINGAAISPGDGDAPIGFAKGALVTLVTSLIGLGIMGLAVLLIVLLLGTQFFR
jgi:hypothetical protein